MNKTIQSNIPRNYRYMFLSNFSLSDPIWMLFLAYRGMTLIEIGLLEAIYHIFSLSFELPTGIIADLFGRRTSRILGRFAALISCLIMISSSDFVGFVIAFLFSALSNNLESGAGDALIYDTLIELKQEDTYIKVKGRQEVCFQSARIGSLIIGGSVASISYEAAYAITAIIHGLAFIQAFSFKEPNIGASQNASHSLGRHFIESLHAIWKNRGVFKLMLYAEGFGLFYTTLYFYMQNHLKGLAYSESVIGFFLAATSLVSMLVSANAHHISSKLGQRRLMLTASVSMLFCLAGIAFTTLSPLFFLGMAAIDGILYVTFSDYINRLLPSDSRATLLSFQSMLFSILMIVVFPIFGWIAEHHGFQAAFIGLFSMALPLSAYTLYILVRRDKRIA